MAQELSVANLSQLGGELIEKIRNKTGLSHEMSQVTLQSVLLFLQENIPNMPVEINLLLESLYVPNAIRNAPTIIDASLDAQQLRLIFKKLTECKDDEQQRSWALHEDEKMIMDNLEELIQILKQADQSISIHVMAEGHYNHVHALVLYYQMETRWSIRSLLLEVFALMSTIDRKALSVLLNSILPMELAREITCTSCDDDDVVGGGTIRIKLAATLLGLLWSSGEPMPITHFDQVGNSFISFIFGLIENPPQSLDDEELVDVFTNLILAYNLQFDDVLSNITLQAFAKTGNAKAFTQKVVYLLNWEEDPIAVLPHKDVENEGESDGGNKKGKRRKGMNSVVKLATDLFQLPETAEIFYTNDVKVLIDIVTRCLTDLGPCEPKRNDYLQLMKMVIRNTNYMEHGHRKADLQKTFTSILLEEEESSKEDQELVNSIMEEFPNLFL